MTSLTTYSSIPYPVSTDQLVDYPSTAATAAQYVDPLPNANLILNPAFTVQQRGAALLTNPASGYVTDGWRWDTNRSAGTETVQVYSDSVGDFPLAYAVRMTATGATHTLSRLAQRIPGADTAAGQTVTLSFWAKYTTTASTIQTINLVQNFGTGGTPSADVTTTIASGLALTTTWTRYIYTFAVPSVSGKTFGFTTESYLQLGFDMGSAAAYNVSIANVQLEQRPTASRFVVPNLATELARCQRRYFRISNSATAPGGSVPVGFGIKGTTTQVLIWVPFPVTMSSFGITPTWPVISSSTTLSEFSVLDGTTARPPTGLPAAAGTAGSWQAGWVSLALSTGTAAANTLSNLFINGGTNGWIAWSTEQ